LIIPFDKAHGARNDFLLTSQSALSQDFRDPESAAIAICDRTAGVGADGWILIGPGSSEAHASIQLWNADGSRSEISGNGTRCAAALLIEQGVAKEEIRIATGAGVKHLRVLEQIGLKFRFEMGMGRAIIEEAGSAIVPGRESVILNVGNPQCAVFCQHFDFDWKSLGATLERHPRFPSRTNVSFIRVVDPHTLEVRFFERGAGVTMSSGTGSTGAAAAAIARGLVSSPVRVLTPAGPLELRLENHDFYLVGPAELVARGEFHYNQPVRQS
jgi:diaminopimelate epimerase